MMNAIGIRHEDKYRMERRTPIVPSLVRKLVQENKLKVCVQSSPKRVFPDADYEKAGALVTGDLKDCGVVFGVKEIPPEAFEKGKTYVFFSHVIKGQSYNMPMLRRMMELGCSLIDYERIADEKDRRLIFFGRFAGLAGMINSLWSLGQRLREYGHKDNPFLRIKQSFRYTSLAEAKADISEAGRIISEKGLPRELLPLTIGFTGYGNVSHGAQEIAHLLPIREISPAQLLSLSQNGPGPANVLYKVVFREEHLVRPKAADKAFDLQEYYRHPERYQNDFEPYVPQLSVLMNCMYWDARYPRLLTKEYLKKLFAKGNPKLVVVGDITCDPDGSVEFTHQGTEIEDPVFVYNPDTGKPSMGFGGHGMLVMAVDILPSELPRDSSQAFSDALSEFILPIARADFSNPGQEPVLPDPVRKALILHQGRLTPDYEYLLQYLQE
jgi:alpha-aminoadipic semialdehyde synthase